MLRNLTWDLRISRVSHRVGKTDTWRTFDASWLLFCGLNHSTKPVFVGNKAPHNIVCFLTCRPHLCRATPNTSRPSRFRNKKKTREKGHVIMMLLLDDGGRQPTKDAARVSRISDSPMELKMRHCDRMTLVSSDDCRTTRRGEE